MKRSPLHSKNAELGARFTGFGGWEMPVQFEGVLAEHRAVRNSSGFFDVSHLGRFELTGTGAHAAVRSLLCNDIDRIAPGRCQYTMLLNDEGGIVDDLIVWWWEDARFWVLPNAANHERVMEAFRGEPDTSVADLRESTVMLAVQGPDAPGVIEQAVGTPPKRFRMATSDRSNTVVAMAGTGYTGEPGAEICLDPAVAEDVVDGLVAAGSSPAGLGSRDTLRLEAGLSLWGEDLDETVSPLEAGLDPFVSFDHEFVGRDALLAQRERGLERSRVGFVLEDRGVARHGHGVRSESGSRGTVTSGNMSPMIGKGVGLARMSPPPPEDDRLEIEIRGKWVPAVQKQPPFHK